VVTNDDPNTPDGVSPPAALASRQVAVCGSSGPEHRRLVAVHHSGELANQLMHAFAWEREYACACWHPGDEAKAACWPA